MRVLILEDEELAAERLQEQLRQLEPEAAVLAVLDSVEEAVGFLQQKPSIDLAFFDIQLADGASFQVFERTEVPCPVIFTTAYDQYALRAFKVNSIDYLLKPIATEDLEKALQQYEQLRQSFGQQQQVLQQVEQAMNMLQRRYKQRFIVRSAHQFLSVKAEDVLYFFSEHKTTWLRHREGRKHALDYSLEQLEEMLDPSSFFRVNRQYIVHIEGVKQATVYSNARLKLTLGDGEEALVSRDRVGRFKSWLGD
jgi:DNA-binding LytR/AlgR family response regulator